MKSAGILLATILGLAAAAALAAPVATEPTVAATTQDPPEAESDVQPEGEAEAQAAGAGEDKELKLPPGFKKVKRGKHTLYCIKTTPIGTRFKSETCYDEPNMRAYILALEQNKSDIDRIRNTCSNFCACGGDC